MNYKVLYRKYRPSTFSDVVGQNKTIELIQESIINDKLAHAYIFSGPRGTGKTSTAKLLAKTVNCLSPENGNPCGKCVNCLNFETSSDIYEIDAASNNGVDQIREIIDNIKLAPINSRFKVYIIDEVHMLSQSAFNALLLTLEEPPAHVMFILATTDIEDVPITVLSRCQRLEFRKITNVDIEKNLRKISELEKIDITDEAIHEIAVYSDGGMRDALSVLDQMSKENKKIEVEDILTNIGLISTQNIINLLDMIEKNESQNIINFVENCITNAYDIKTLIKKIIVQIKEREVGIKTGNFQSNLSYSDYKKLAFDLSDLLWKNNVNLDSFILLELILLDYIKSPENAEKSDDFAYIKTQENQADFLIEKNEKNIAEKIQNLDEKIVEKNKQIVEAKTTEKVEEKITKKASKNEEDSFYIKLAEARTHNCFINADKSLKINNIDNWKNYLLHENSRKIKGLLTDTEIAICSKDILILVHPYEENAVEICKNIEQIEKLYNNFSKSSYKMSCLDLENWKNIAAKFAEDYKKGIKYDPVQEPVQGEEILLNDVFTNDKIEIQ